MFKCQLQYLVETLVVKKRILYNLNLMFHCMHCLKDKEQINFIYLYKESGGHKKH